MPVGGLLLRFGGEILRFLQFASSAVILGIFSYYLAVQTRQNVYIQTWERAVEGISGAATLYTLFGLLLTCFLGGHSFFAAIAMILDLLFVGAFIALAVMTRGGDQNCSYISNEDSLRFGADGLGNPNTSYVPSTYHACTLLKATFILSIVGAVLFLLSIPYQLLIAKHHHKEKRENPHVKYGVFGRRRNNAPNTPVVAGQKRGFWRRNRRADPEAGYVNGAGIDNRLSGETRYGNTAVEPKYGHVNNNNAVNY